MNQSRHVAFDLGAESGRTLVGELNDGRLDVRVINRFPNKPVSVAGHLHWNVFQLFEQMKLGLARRYASSSLDILRSSAATPFRSENRLVATLITASYPPEPTASSNCWNTSPWSPSSRS